MTFHTSTQRLVRKKEKSGVSKADQAGGPSEGVGVRSLARGDEKWQARGRLCRDSSGARGGRWTEREERPEDWRARSPVCSQMHGNGTGGSQECWDQEGGTSHLRSWSESNPEGSVITGR